jgi:hypothetical protein
MQREPCCVSPKSKRHYCPGAGEIECGAAEVPHRRPRPLRRRRCRCRRCRRRCRCRCRCRRRHHHRRRSRRRIGNKPHGSRGQRPHFTDHQHQTRYLQRTCSRERSTAVELYLVLVYSVYLHGTGQRGTTAQCLFIGSNSYHNRPARTLSRPSSFVARRCSTTFLVHTAFLPFHASSNRCRRRCYRLQPTI